MKLFMILIPLLLGLTTGGEVSWDPTYLLVYQGQDDCTGSPLKVNLHDGFPDSQGNLYCDNCWDRCAAGLGTSPSSFRVVGPGKVAIAWNCIGGRSYPNALFHLGGNARTQDSGCLRSQGGGTFALCHSATFTGVYGATWKSEFEAMCGPAPRRPTPLATCDCAYNGSERRVTGPGDTSTCKVIGDPHIFPFGGTRTEFHQQGLYELARFTIAPCGCEVVIQAFFDIYNEHLQGWTTATATAAVAVRVGGATFEFTGYGDVTISEGGSSTSYRLFENRYQERATTAIKLERAGPMEPDGETCNRLVQTNDGCWGVYKTGWRLHLPGGAGNLLVIPWLGNGVYWYDTWLHVAKSVKDGPGGTTGLCHENACGGFAWDGANLFSCDVSQQNSGGQQCHPVLKADAIFSDSALLQLQVARGVDPSTRACRRRLQSNELPSQPPAAASNDSYISVCAAAGIDPATVLASCDAGCGRGMAESCAYDYCATGDSSFFNRSIDICAIDKNEMLPSPPSRPPSLPPPPPAPPLPCIVLADCEANCTTAFQTCKSNGENKCKKKRKMCKNDCAAEPSLCPPCEDNTIPGFGSWWCELNAPDPSFCSNEAQMSKCKKTCRLCG